MTDNRSLRQRVPPQGVEGGPPSPANRVLIAGGGIGGLTAALCLARVGLRAVVFEQAPAFAALGAGIQITPNATAVLHQLGLGAALSTRATRPSAIALRHWRSGKVLGKVEVTGYQHPCHHMHRGDLVRLLADAAARTRLVELRADAKVTSVALVDDGARATVAQAGQTREWAGAALIGADGAHSTVRKALFGDAGAQRAGGVAWRALVPAAGLAASRREPTAWFGPRRHFVHYPVRGGRLVNCVAVVEKNSWPAESWCQRGDAGELRADFSDWHEDVRALIAAAAQDSLHKRALCDRAPLRRWSQGAATLLGDACHPMLPFLAQGAAMAIEDAAVLAACLAAAEPPEALRRYQRLRRRRTALAQRLSRRNAKIFHLQGAGAWLRNRVLAYGAKRTMDRFYRYDAFESVR